MRKKFSLALNVVLAQPDDQNDKMCCCCQCGASASKNFIFHTRISIIPRSKLISTHFLNQFECNHRKIAALNCENMFGVGNFIRKTSMTLLPSSHFAYSLARGAKKIFFTLLLVRSSFTLLLLFIHFFFRSHSQCRPRTRVFRLIHMARKFPVSFSTLCPALSVF